MENFISELKITYRKTDKVIDNKLIANSKDAFEVLTKIYDENDRYIFETFYALYLTTNNKVIGFAKIGEGRVCSTTASTQKILKFGIDSMAASIIISHNHPSGSVEPSENDKNITRNIIKACDIMEIKVLDHIVMGENKYLSFKDEGIL